MIKANQPHNSRGKNFFKSKWVTAIGIAGAVGILGLVAVVTMAAQKNSKGSTPAKEEALGYFGEEAKQAGVKTCTNLFNALGSTLSQNAQFSFKTFAHQQKPDLHAVQSLTGLVYGPEDAPSRGAGVVYAAPVNGKCEGVMVRTVLSPQSCEDVIKTQLPEGTKRDNDLMSTAIFQLPGNGHVMLMPVTTTSCTVITTLNLFDQ